MHEASIPWAHQKMAQLALDSKAPLQNKNFDYSLGSIPLVDVIYYLSLCMHFIHYDCFWGIELFAGSLLPVHQI